MCVKGTDTVYFDELQSSNYTSNPVDDSLNNYYNNGFTETAITNYPVYQTQCVIGQKAIQNALGAGQYCFEPANGTCSNNERCE
jgi:hypothetical protein